MRRLLLCVLVRLLHDGPGRAYVAASAILDAVAATRPSSQATSTPSPRPAPSTTPARRRPASREERRPSASTLRALPLIRCPPPLPSLAE